MSKRDPKPPTPKHAAHIETAINSIIADLLLGTQVYRGKHVYHLPAVTFTYEDCSHVYDAVQSWFSGFHLILEYPTGTGKKAVRDGDFAKIFVK